MSCEYLQVVMTLNDKNKRHKYAGFLLVFKPVGQNGIAPDLWGSFRTFWGRAKMTYCNYSKTIDFLPVFFFIITDNYSESYS